MFKFKPAISELSDEKLVREMIIGNQLAFNQLYQRYNQRLLYYFYRMLGGSNEKAQDFLQDLFIKVIDKIETFDPSRKFSTWLFSIAHNMCKNEYRRLNIRKDTPIEPYAEMLPNNNDLEIDFPDIDLEQFTRDLFEELENFDEIHKTAFILRYREGFSLKEIASILEISEGTVKSRLFYTRKQLSDRLVKYQPKNNPTFNFNEL